MDHGTKISWPNPSFGRQNFSNFSELLSSVSLILSKILTLKTERESTITAIQTNTKKNFKKPKDQLNAKMHLLLTVSDVFKYWENCFRIFFN